MTRLMVKPNRIENDFDRLFNSFFNHGNFPVFNSASQGDFNPKVNIVDSKDNINITFELPGMEKSDIKVLVKDNVLTVSGERKFESKVKDENYVRTEIHSGSFSRSFDLPDTVDGDNVSADYKNGLLLVTLAKKEEKKPKEIEVQVS